MQALLISFLATNLTHGYLLLRHRGKGRPTISERAVEDDLSLSIYVAAHFIGGLAFAVFSYGLFYIYYDSEILFSLAIAGIITEWLQAVVPARGRYLPAHTALAYVMSFFVVAMGVVAIFTLSLPSQDRLALIITEAIIIAGYPVSGVLPYRYFWTIQLFNTNLFYLQMYLLLLAS